MNADPPWDGGLDMAPLIPCHPVHPTLLPLYAGFPLLAISLHCSIPPSAPAGLTMIAGANWNAIAIPLAHLGLALLQNAFFATVCASKNMYHQDWAVSNLFLLLTKICNSVIHTVFVCLIIYRSKCKYTSQGN